MSTSRNKIRGYITLLRPYSWIKNLLVFAPLFFSQEIYDVVHGILALETFVAFCIAASFVYILNDIADYESDRNHPIKQRRPIASGIIKKQEGMVLAVVLAVLLAILCTRLPLGVGVVIAIYIALNMLYSVWWKHVVIVDLILVCSFYLLRVIAGGIAVGVPPSHWLVLCTAFAALFLAAGKRGAELQQKHQRKVLDDYSPELIMGIAVSAATLTIMTYSLYALTVLDTDLALYSVLCIVFAVLRYLAVAYRSNNAEYPERALFADPWVVAMLLLWVLVMYLTLYT